MTTKKNMNNPLPYLKPRFLFQVVFAGYFLLAMHYFLPNMGGYGLYLPYNVIGWMFIATLIGLGFWQISRTGFIELSKTQVLFSIGFLFCLLPLAYSINEISYRTTSRVMFLLGGLGFYTALVQFRFNQSERFTLLYIILGAIGVQSILGVIQYYGLGPGDHFLLVKKTLPYGSFQQKNVMTIFMVTGMGIGLFLIGKDHVLASSRLKRWLVLLPPLTGSIIIMAIKSKAGYLGLLVMFPLLLPTINVKEKLYQRWFMLLVTGLIIGYVSPRAYQFFQSGAQPEGQTETQQEAGLYTRDLGSQIETVNTRIDMWEITFDIWKDNPLTGIGYGKWPRIFREYHAFRRANATGSDYFMGEYLDHPHNETLLWLSEGGIAPFLGLLIFAGGYLIMVFRLKWKNVLSCLALVMPIFLHTQFELPFDISLAHWIVFLTLCHFPDDQQNIRYRYNLHKTMIIPALMIPLMVYYYMGTTLRINSIISRFEHTGMKNYDLLLQVKDSGALHLKYDNYVLKTMLDLGMDTKNEEALQLFLEKAEEFVQRSPILHVYNGMMKALLVLGREKEAKAMVARARYLYPDTNEAWLQPEN